MLSIDDVLIMQNSMAGIIYDENGILSVKVIVANSYNEIQKRPELAPFLREQFSFEVDADMQEAEKLVDEKMEAIKLLNQAIVRCQNDIKTLNSYMVVLKNKELKK